MQDLELHIARNLNDTIAADEAAAKIVYDSIALFLAGYYGDKIGEEDTEANNRDREAGQGRAIGRYTLNNEDFYIIEYYPRKECPHLQLLYCRDY